MKTVLTLLLASVALACSAQSTLPPAPPIDRYVLNAGRHTIKAGNLRQAGAVAIVAGGIVAALVAKNLDNADHSNASINTGYTCAGLLFMAGFSLNIAGNAHEVRAGHIMVHDQLE